MDTPYQRALDTPQGVTLLLGGPCGGACTFSCSCGGQITQGRCGVCGRVLGQTAMEWLTAHGAPLQLIKSCGPCEDIWFTVRRVTNPSWLLWMLLTARSYAPYSALLDELLDAVPVPETRGPRMAYFNDAQTYQDKDKPLLVLASCIKAGLSEKVALTIIRKHYGIK